MAARVLVIGLDSAEPELVRGWAAQGRLPNLARLLQHGHQRDVRNLPGFGNGVFWPCIHTGADPSHHGGYYLRQPAPPDYAVEPFTRHDYLLPPFWRTLDREGFEVAVMDPVEAPWGDLSHGIEVVDWNVHRRESAPQSTPPQLITHILRRYGENPLHGNVDRMVMDGLSPERLAAVAEERIRKKTLAALELLDQRDWDLFMLSYGEAHDIGHRAWHLHDRSADAAPGSLCDPLRDCYERLDGALGQLMTRIAPDGRSIVVMGPGMQRSATGRLQLPALLRAFQGLEQNRFRTTVSRTLRGLTRARWLPWSIRDRLRTERVRAVSHARGRDGHRYYMVPHNDDASALRINLAGREAHGLVAPEDYAATCADLTRRLLALRDAGGARPALSEVIQVRRGYTGPALDRLPDLLLVWNRDADLRAIRCPEHGVFANARGSMRSGDHSRRGLLLSDRALHGAAATTLTPMQVTPVLLRAVRQRSVAPVPA